MTAKVWVAPPNWPSPPPGFVPPPGWQPDPAWGPAPEGWQFWQEAVDELGLEQEAPSSTEPEKGLLDRWRAARAARQEQKSAREEQVEQERERQRYQQALGVWQDGLEALSQALDAAQHFYGIDQSQLGGGWLLKRGERAYALISNVALIEPRRAPWALCRRVPGRSVRVVQGVRYHVGGSRGHYVPGPESPTAIDNGDVLITDQRVVFRGTSHSREWAFAKLLGYRPSPDRTWMAFQVSNRQKVSGIAYGVGVADLVEQQLQLALATFQGSAMPYQRVAAATSHAPSSAAGAARPDQLSFVPLS